MGRRTQKDPQKITCKLDSAICRRPVERLFNLDGVNDNRDSNGLAKPDFLASSKSLTFASRICACFEINKSANVFTLAARSSGVNDCNTRLPVRAEKCFVPQKKKSLSMNSEHEEMIKISVLYHFQQVHQLVLDRQRLFL